MVISVVMPHHLDINLCSSRAVDRGDDGIHDGDTDWRSVCKTMKSQWQCPEESEGLSAVYFCESDEGIETFIDFMISLGIKKKNCEEEENIS